MVVGKLEWVRGSAWHAWAQLRDVALIQMNSSDHNPAARVGASPTDSWKLATPQLAQPYVKGSARNHGQHGFVFSNANWDPYPLANEIEAFTIALANMDAAVAQRLLRFTNTFFTVMAPSDESPGEPGRFHLTQGSEIDSTALIQNVEDLQGQTRLKVTRTRAAVDDTIELLAEDLLTGTYWLDLRKTQVPSRGFGTAPTAVLSAFRSTLPSNGNGASSAALPIHEIAATFIRLHPAANFYKDTIREPDGVSRRQITE